MLHAKTLIPMTDAEREIFEEIIPNDHFLRRLAAVIDFERFRPLLEAAYCGGLGRPPLDVLVMLKLELLERQYGLSDREVMSDGRLNLAYRWLLGLSLKSPLPHHTSMTYFRERLGPATLQISKKQCGACPLRAQCLTGPEVRSRQVTKSDYDVEYAAAQAKVRTPEYAKVRREHPAIERKFAELVGRHGLRHARYRGRLRVLYQSLATAFVVNLKRIVRLAQNLRGAGGGTVRAELAALG